jgi:mannose-6-phosphate isomerase-like protein (cupin superfamily)
MAEPTAMEQDPKWPTLERQTAYERWLLEEGIPVVRGSAIPSLHEVALAPWPRMGGRGAYVSLADQQDDDGYVVEIAPGGSLNPERHMFEELIYVCSGRGTTEVWQDDGGATRTLEWQRGSVFAVPLNAAHRHHNTSGREPARLFAVTSFPKMLNLMRDRAFIFGNPWRFRDRFDAESDYFTREGHDLGQRQFKTNFIPDVRTFELRSWAARGAKGTNRMFSIASSAMAAHISQFGVGTYKKAHRHGAGAHVVILSGTGYSLLWEEGKPRTKVPWSEGAVLSPADREFHQHFNTGPEPARYLALRWNNAEFPIEGHDHYAKRMEGGDQIEYEDEDPAVREEYEEELRRRGVRSLMDEVAPRRQVATA